MENTHHSFQRVSANVKTGPIATTYTSAITCPDSCPLKGKCYANGGPVAIHWRKLNTQGLSTEELAAQIRTLPQGSLWRHNVAGDLPGLGDSIDGAALGLIVKANKSRKGFTYTHKPITNHRQNRAWVSWANREGFTVNVSANSLRHADELAREQVAPVVVILPEGQKSNTSTPEGRKVVVCPATKNNRVTCSTCGLCQKRDRGFIIGFPAHGTFKRLADTLAKTF